MRTRIDPRAIVLLLLALAAAACNLSRTLPTATPAPVTPPAVTSGPAPTLFASITPLANGTFPTQLPPGNCTPPANWVQYTVEVGDSLGALAEATGTTLQNLITANCLTDPDTLFTGQVIYLPRSPISG